MIKSAFKTLVFAALFGLASGWANCPVISVPGYPYFYIQWPGYIEVWVACDSSSERLFCVREICAEPVCHESNCM